MAEIWGLGPVERVCLGWCVHRQLEQNAGGKKKKKQHFGSWPNVGWYDRGHQSECSHVSGTLGHHYFQLPNVLAKPRWRAQRQGMKS